MKALTYQFCLLVASILFSSLALADAMCGPDGQFNPNDNRCWPVQGRNSKPAKQVDYWGAIALEKKGARGNASTNYSTESEAIDHALQSCGDNCVVYITFKNTCGAVVTGRNKYLAAELGSNPKTLRSSILSKCNSQTDNCQVWVEPACSGR